MAQLYLEKYIKNISDNMIKLLKINSMNILELSNKTKISYSSLYNLVHQKQNPTLETLLRICSVLDVEFSQLVGDKELLRDTSTSIKEVPIISCDMIDSYLSGEQSSTGQENKITISCNKKILNPCFALKAESLTRLLNNSILIFEKTNSDFTKYSNHIVLTSLSGQPPSLKRLLIDGKSLFLESIDQNLPTRELFPSEQIIAWLFQSRADF
jgi:transcriptional regulator with XRE-family HTH domain